MVNYVWTNDNDFIVSTPPLATHLHLCCISDRWQCFWQNCWELQTIPTSLVREAEPRTMDCVRAWLLPASNITRLFSLSLSSWVLALSLLLLTLEGLSYFIIFPLPHCLLLIQSSINFQTCLQDHWRELEQEEGSCRCCWVLREPSVQMVQPQRRGLFRTVWWKTQVQINIKI